ncbi:hypothetical protein BRADI_3g27520v3 [Brachypodium distachyon]|uniref:E2F/DP family winged-helix DNA-binding domain-containing protein n=1 Tax=Brachypodium distachyon TaxID=15368 RepID=A0A0Q3JEW6_BRADI|nr:hypothetical protein BRADI_3g27520v3 [Brachypodium distachyon]
MVPGARSTGGVAHSASNSAANAGSPSGRSRPGKGAAAAAATTSASTSTPARGSTVARRLSDLEIKGDGAPSPQTAASKKKKKGAHVVGPDKGNRGLRQFSMKVCEKVESKGRTTYNEVADELVAEFSDPNSNIGSPDPDNPNTQQYDEKNIRRRVYDALNVLMAMDIIYKDKKEIQWKGLPRTSMSDIDKLKIKLIGQKGRIDKKSAYLQELQDQYVGLQNLVERNEQLYSSGDAPSGGVALPFILVQFQYMIQFQGASIFFQDRNMDSLRASPATASSQNWLFKMCTSPAGSPKLIPYISL